MNRRSAFSAIDLILGCVVIFALFMYFLPTIKSYSRKPLDSNVQSVEEQVEQKVQDVNNLRQQAEEQNRKMLEQMNY